jgi:hypothetical protein
VDLRKRLQLEEALTTQLAQETDTIGDYIALYQQHRQSTAAQLKEKDMMLAELGLVTTTSGYFFFFSGGRGVFSIAVESRKQKTTIFRAFFMSFFVRENEIHHLQHIVCRFVGRKH